MDGPHRTSRITVIVIMLFAVWASAQFRYVGVPGNDWHEAINSDGKGYYEYIRMWLTPGDPALHKGMGPLHPSVNAPVISHFGGAAICMAPFVLVAHSYTLFNTGKPEDGYSLHYQIAVGIAALFYLAIGLFGLRRVLLGMGIQDAVVAFTLVIITLGTGLITQAVVHPAMSHVYGFATVAMLLLVAQRFIKGPSPAKLVACAALLGVAVIIRPVNALLVFALPLAAFGTAVNTSAVKALLRSRWAVVAALIFAMVVAVQGVLWYLQSGAFIINSYPNEGFHWGRPQFLASWFHPRNGLFFYWPLLLLFVPGFFVLLGRTRHLAGWFLLFTASFTYVTSCWWNWAYGDNFGQRTYVDMLPVFALPIALAVPFTTKLRWALAVPATLLCALNLFQGWQYLNYILVPGQVDLPKYEHVFLTTDPAHAMDVGGHEDLPLYAPHGREVLPAQFVMFPRSASGSDTTLIARAAMPFATMGKATYFELDVERTESIARASADTRIALRFRNKEQIRPIHSWRMNVVPNGAPTERWHYAFNLYAQQQGDTLEVLCTGGKAGCLLSTASAQFSVAR